MNLFAEMFHANYRYDINSIRFSLRWKFAAMQQNVQITQLFASLGDATIFRREKIFSRKIDEQAERAIGRISFMQ